MADYGLLYSDVTQFGNVFAETSEIVSEEPSICTQQAGLEITSKKIRQYPGILLPRKAIGTCTYETMD